MTLAVSSRQQGSVSRPARAAQVRAAQGGRRRLRAGRSPRCGSTARLATVTLLPMARAASSTTMLHLVGVWLPGWASGDAAGRGWAQCSRCHSGSLIDGSARGLGRENATAAAIEPVDRFVYRRQRCLFRALSPHGCRHAGVLRSLPGFLSRGCRDGFRTSASVTSQGRFLRCCRLR